MSLGMGSVQCAHEADVKTDQSSACFLRAGKKTQNRLTTFHLKLPGSLALYSKLSVI